MNTKYNPAQEVANLRLPVPFFDLLMVLLVTCLVFVAPIPQDGEKLQAMDISIAQGKAAPAADALLAVTPRQTTTGWVFAVAGENDALGPGALAKRATAEGRKIVVVVPPATALQDFVSMQAAMAALHVPFALAIKHKEALP
jgi:hypothetical protein